MDESEVVVPHGWVADRMGYSIAGVSLLRSGKRQPTITTMELVEKTFGWSINDQIDNRRNYPEAFNAKIAEVWQKEIEK